MAETKTGSGFAGLKAAAATAGNKAPGSNQNVGAPTDPSANQTLENKPAPDNGDGKPENTEAPNGPESPATQQENVVNPIPLDDPSNVENPKAGHTPDTLDSRDNATRPPDSHDNATQGARDAEVEGATRTFVANSEQAPDSESNQPLKMYHTPGIERYKVGRFQFEKGRLELRKQKDVEEFQKVLDDLAENAPRERNRIKTISIEAAEAMVRSRAPAVQRGVDSASNRIDMSGLKMTGTDRLEDIGKAK